MKMQAKLMSCVAVLGCLLFTARAEAAADGYVCSMGFDPQSSNMGSYGYIYLSVYSAPDCQGSYRGGGYLCSVGATSPSCASTHLYRENALYHVFDALQNAVALGEHIYVSADSLLRLMIVYFR